MQTVQTDLTIIVVFVVGLFVGACIGLLAAGLAHMAGED